MELYYAELSVILLIISLGLLFAELFLPSGGMILVVALVCLAGSVWFAWKQWWGENPTIFWSYLAGVVVLVPIAVAAMLYIFPRTGVGRKILLEGPSPDEVTPYADEAQQLRKLIGRTGKTITLMSPGGLVQIDGKRMHCETEGMLLDPGIAIEVVNVKGTRLVVRPARERVSDEEIAPADESESDGSEPFLTERDAPESEDSPLDFDLPRG